MTNFDKKTKMIAIAIEHGVDVDRWGNIKWIDDCGQMRRYKFAKNVVRLEIQLDTKRWIKVHSFGIKKASIPWWHDACVTLADLQGDRACIKQSI